MTDLTAGEWADVENFAFIANGQKAILLGTLRNIIRKARRTTDQNALLWALYDDVLKLGGEALAGWSRDDLHEFALGEYFGWDVSEAFGRKRMKPKRRSSRLTKAEFSDFVDAFVRLMAGHGIVLTLPGEIDGQTSRI
jgi:hypothetical protein